MAGAKQKLTDAIQEKICQAVRLGNNNVVSAAYGGISETTFYRWIKEGQAAKTGSKRLFWEAIKKAEADAEVGRIARISAAGASGTWQADAWWLERKFPERWGRTVQSVEHSGKINVSQLSDDELAAIVSG